MLIQLLELLVAPIIVGATITLLAYWLRKRDK